MTGPDFSDLSTPRLHLRRPVETDAAAIIALAGDWEVARHLGRVPHPYTREDFRFFIDCIVTSEPTWAILLRQNQELIGVIGVAPNAESRTAELGYYLGRRHWGRGLATEAAQAVVRAALDSRRYGQLTSRYHADNPSSGRVLAKLGFQTVGRSHHHCLAEGRDKPTIEMELVLRPAANPSGW